MKFAANILRTCTTWEPGFLGHFSNISYTCVGGGNWEFLGVGIDKASKENCLMLCKKRRGIGCCFFSDIFDDQCYWKEGGIANLANSTDEYPGFAPRLGNNWTHHLYGSAAVCTGNYI